MAINNKITSTGTFTIGDPNGLQAAFSLTISNMIISGSNVSFDGKDITSGSWQTLNTSSLSDLRYAVFKNNGTGSIKLAGSSAGAGINPIVCPGDICIIPFTGSNLPLYAQAMTSGTGSTLDYGVSEG